MTPIDDISDMFHKEFTKLENLIDGATAKSKLPIPEIIEIYYQIINVSSMSAMIKQQLKNSDERHPLIGKIDETLKFISKFDSSLHQSIKGQLADSLADTTQSLQSENATDKSKDEIESKAKLYEKLRQTMSTREFVEQYDKGLS